MAVNNIIKRIQNIMRQDAGINGDAQRIEQMTWMFFLKVYDTRKKLGNTKMKTTSLSSPKICVGVNGQ